MFGFEQTSKPSLSIVIRSYTQTDELVMLLECLGKQSTLADELVIIDSGSANWVVQKVRLLCKDGLNGHQGDNIPVKLLEIDKGDYQSARALNQAIAHTRCDLVAIISQDALPVDNDYLKYLVEAMEDDTIAGAYGRQKSYKDKDNLLWEKDLHLTYPAESRTQYAPDCWFVNTCSIIRRKLWEEHPFDEHANISEDHEWAKWAQAQGYAIRYEARAVVYHFHHFPGMRNLWNRFYEEGKGLAYIHQVRVDLPRSVFRYLREIASDGVWLTRKGRPWRFPASVYRRAIKHAALYNGYRDGLSKTESEDAPKS
ncbi:MAG: glycosyltransferase family 2 protein [Candidatus Sumerlaeia bacterium]